MMYLCGGNGTCGKCKVKVIQGASEPTETEKKFFSKGELEEGYRLACQTHITKDCVVEIPARHRKMQGLSVAVSSPEEKKGQKCGIAIDLGTTTLAFALVDLKSHDVVKTYTIENSQRIFGADVMSRMQRANEGALEELRNLIIQDVKAGVAAVCSKQNRQSEISHIVISGNTTMCHLLQGMSCEKLAVAPFIPVSLEKKEWEVDGVRITILPGVSAFVGGDIISGLSYLDFAKDDTPKMLLDLGTNGELVLWDGKEFKATTAAAGPALEGGNISQGCASVYGAIYDVVIARKNAQVKTIGDVAPVGICGSGLLAAVGGLLSNGILDESGAFSKEVKEEGFVLATSEDVGEIRITQEDIRAFMMAKSAIATGIGYLLAQVGDKKEQLQVYLAGGMGVHLPIQAALRTGLFPEQIKSNCKPVGNTSLHGAIAYLLDSKEMDERITSICQNIKVCPLNEWEEFEERFIQNLSLRKV